MTSPLTPEAVTEALAFNTRYYVPNLPQYECRWTAHPRDYERLRDGLVFLTEAAAVAAAKRMTGDV